MFSSWLVLPARTLESLEVDGNAMKSQKQISQFDPHLNPKDQTWELGEVDIVVGLCVLSIFFIVLFSIWDRSHLSQGAAWVAEASGAVPLSEDSTSKGATWPGRAETCPLWMGWCGTPWTQGCTVHPATAPP